MNKHSKHLTFGVRQYAAGMALLYADIQERGLTLSELAEIQGVSKTYAARLMDGWVRAGIAMKVAEPYRKNATMSRYYFTWEGAQRFRKSYVFVAEQAYMQVKSHVRNERIARVMAI